MAKKKAGHTTKVLRTSIEGVKVKINTQHYGDGTLTIRGYLIDSRTEQKLDLDLKLKDIEGLKSQEAEKERILVERLVKAYREATKTVPTVKYTRGPYSQCYLSLSEDERAEICPNNWGETTRKQGLAYFKSTMLPILDRIGLDIDFDSEAEILDQMKKAAEENGNYLGNPEQTVNKITQHAKDFNMLYSEMRELCPEYGLPEIKLPVYSGSKTVQAEQFKALPTEGRVKLAAILMKLVSNGLAIGGVLMMTSMVRTAEACVPCFRDIVFFEDYSVYAVLWQNGRVKVADLKSKAAYRVIVLPKYATEALRMRKEWLLSQGYRAEEIQNLPVVSAANDPRVMADPNDLSAFLRGLLSLLGFKRGYWDAVSEVMLAEPDLDGNRKRSRDPSAYVLRRNGCTLCCNVCGMDPDLVDALMGHKLSRDCREQWNHYIRRPENWPIIAAQLERVVYHPLYSANPAFAPIVLRADEDYASVCDQVRFCLQADPGGEEVEVELTVETLEADEEIVLESPRRGVRGEVRAIAREDSKYTPIIGEVRELDDYLAMVREAEMIDLSKFLPERCEEVDG